MFSVELKCTVVLDYGVICLMEAFVCSMLVKLLKL